MSKFLSISICGLTNSGKSTLVNRFLGEKLSIISQKKQTTRTTIKGIYSKDDTQIVFYDTPGIFKNISNNLDKYLLKNAWTNVFTTDYAILLIDSTKGFLNLDLILEKFKNSEVEAILVFNKIDKIDKKNLLIYASKLNEKYKFKDIFMISAKTGSGVDDLLNYLLKLAKTGSFLYDKELLTDIPSKFLASEITREKIFAKLHEELPYRITIYTESWVEEDDIISIKQVIFTSQERYKKIIIGKMGEMLSKIGYAARKEMQDLFQKKIRLDLYVKLKEDWINNLDNLEEIGVNYN